jgi:hypothetical protein
MGATVTRNAEADSGTAWTTPIEGALTIHALALSGDGDFVYAAGSKASGEGFVVRLRADGGGMIARLDLKTAVLALAAGNDGAIYAGGSQVRKLDPELSTVFLSDPGGLAVGLVAGPEGAIYAAINSGGQAFLSKLSADGSQWLYRTSVGPAEAAAIVWDGEAIYVTGSTASLDLGVRRAAQEWRNGMNDAFVTKFNGQDGAVVWSTYLGGGGSDGATCEW